MNGRWYHRGQPGSWKRELFSQLSARWIALRCRTAIRIDYSLPKLRRGRARSYYTTRPRPSLARSRSSSSEDRSRRATGPPFLPTFLLRYARCPVPDVTDPLVPCLPRDSLSSFVGSAGRPSAPFSFLPRVPPMWGQWSCKRKEEISPFRGGNADFRGSWEGNLGKRIRRD